MLVGTVAGDGERHADGTQAFYDATAALLRLQEGGLTVSAPAMRMRSEQLLLHSKIEDAALARTHSCHRDDVPCGNCPGCAKRRETLVAAGRLR